MPGEPVARNKLDEFGVDAICAAVSDGTSLTAISAQVGVSIGSLLTWINADAERSARVADVRRHTAWYWDERAQTVIEAAKADPVEMSRARELASHFRWRASKISPAYGDRVQQQQLDKNGNPTDPPSKVVVELIGR